MDFGRDILSTDLELDITSLKGKATIRLAPSDSSTGASFEASGLTIVDVNDPSQKLNFEVKEGRLDVGVPKGVEAAELRIEYLFTTRDSFDGYLGNGLTFLWPKFCGNLFPCKSAPDDGVSFTMAVNGVPAGQDAIFPKTIPAAAPSYMPALAVGDYEYLEIGTTLAGTKVGVWHLAGEQADAIKGTADLAKVFDWLEKTYGAYLYGSEVASVSADWGPGAYGGMEHHPFWHVGRDSMSDPVTHAHEAAHGWFGNGVRMRCWEDFVLSEGTVSYLAARGLEAAGGAMVGQAVWDSYKADLDAAVANEDTIAWPSTCNAIDIINDPLWSTVPYMKGAFFYKKVEEQVGVAELDKAIAKFYATYAGQAAGMQDMLDTIKAETGFDPAQLADGWLKSLKTP
jgi:aminopeptidase N